MAGRIAAGAADPRSTQADAEDTRMSDPLADLEPRSLWQHFSSIASIPRPSKHEEKIVAWVRSLAERRGIPVRSDATGNLVLDVPASPGREGAPIVILQAHLDMVCEKNRGVEHDLMNDPIRPRIDGEWVCASGTTLGADNGIGVAAALAATTDASVVHGPLQLLFTLDEETGLTGAQGLDSSLVDGTLLLNLDSEEDGVLYIGCAGGADSHLFLDLARQRPRAGGRPWRLELGGLRGGHSGMNINENRGNAIKLLCRVLMATIESGTELQLAGLRGGRMHNAIPREAEAVFHLPEGAEEAFRRILTDKRDEFRVQLAGVDDGLRIELEPTDDGGDVLTGEDRDRLLRLLLALPHGVLAMCADIPGLVETSANLASVSDQDGRIRIVTSSRSSVGPDLKAVLGSIAAAGGLAGAEVRTHDGYPGWKPNLDSPLVEVVRRVYAEVWQQEPVVTAVHAGLECGLLGERISGLDMISFGPQIEGAHSPEERVNIPSVGRFWTALVKVLDRLGQPA
jgi:dipeptidase D